MWEKKRKRRAEKIGRIGKERGLKTQDRGIKEEKS